MNQQRKGFDVQYRGISIWQCPTLRSGVTIGSPIFGWANAALAWGYKWEDFQDLDNQRQAFLVAAHETKQQIEAVLAFQQIKRLRQ